MTRILGVDPGLNVTGYGVIDLALPRPKLVEAGALKISSGLPLEKRLLGLHDGLAEIIQTCEPDTMAVEALFSNYKHPTSAIQMAHARGAFFLAAAQANIPVFSYEPARVKKSLTGQGRATKAQMQNMVKTVFELEEAPKPADVADALAIALCHANSLRDGTVSRASGPSSRRLPAAIEQALEETNGKMRPGAEFEKLVQELAAKKK